MKWWFNGEFGHNTGVLWQGVVKLSKWENEVSIPIGRQASKACRDYSDSRHRFGHLFSYVFFPKTGTRFWETSFSGLVMLGVVLLFVAGCSTQPVVSNFPDLRVDPVPTPGLMTPDEQGAAIEDLQNAADRNKGG